MQEKMWQQSIHQREHLWLTCGSPVIHLGDTWESPVIHLGVTCGSPGSHLGEAHISSALLLPWKRPSLMINYIRSDFLWLQNQI